MEKYKSNIKDAISKWNLKHPELRKKTLGSIAAELGISTSALSQIELSNQFQIYASVILNGKTKDNKIEIFKAYQKLDIPVIKKLTKITEILGCEIYDIIKNI